MVSFTPVSPPTPYTHPSPHPYAPYAQPIFLLDFITRTILGEEYKSFSFSLCSLLHSPVTSSLLGPNLLLNNTFSNALSFLSSRNVSDQVSHPYKTTGKIIILYILIVRLKLQRTAILTCIWSREIVPVLGTKQTLKVKCAQLHLTHITYMKLVINQ